MTPKSLLLCIVVAAIGATTVDAASLRGTNDNDAYYDEKLKPPKEHESMQLRELQTDWARWQNQGQGQWSQPGRRPGRRPGPGFGRRPQANAQGCRGKGCPGQGWVQAYWLADDDDWYESTQAPGGDAHYTEGYYSGWRNNGRVQNQNNWNYQNNNNIAGYVYQIPGRHGGYTYQWEGYNQGGWYNEGNRGRNNRPWGSNGSWSDDWADDGW